MRTASLSFFLVMLLSLVSLALALQSPVYGKSSAVAPVRSEKPKSEPEAQPEPEPEPEPVVESESAQRWKSLKAQEDWVARLKKQAQGEVNQLGEMRTALAQAFKLDVKKLEAGQYEFDEKKDKFVEKKPPAA